MNGLSDETRHVAGSFRDLQHDGDKKAVVDEIRTAKPELILGGNKDKLRLWPMLFGLLGAIGVVLTIGAVICLVRDKDTAASMLVTPVTAIITGMLGLFAASPTNSS
jgi:hypothetical protein